MTVRYADGGGGGSELYPLPFGAFLLAVPAAGYLRDLSGGYTLPFQVFVVGFALTAILTLFLREPPPATTSQNETSGGKSGSERSVFQGSASQRGDGPQGA